MTLNRWKLAAAMTMTATITVVGLVEPARAFIHSFEFYCGAATRPTNCDTRGIVDPIVLGAFAHDITIYISEHANFGERCQLRDAAGRAFTGWAYIDAGDGGGHVMARKVRAGTRFDVWCQRRSDHGDAGLTGVVEIRI